MSATLEQRERAETHECAWCLQERACEPARAGSGHLWICAACADDMTEQAS